MSKWLDPWPAVSDLFSGLLVASFAGLIVFTGIESISRVEATEIRREADTVSRGVLNGLQSALGGETRQCGVEDICLDISIQFATDSDKIGLEDKARLARACEAVNTVLPRYETGRRRELEILIEGHTDPQQPRSAMDERTAYLYNWRLSGNRASSVLYEFAQCGVKAPESRIVAIGYADSDPVPGCDADTAGCNTRNRRTTFRLRPDLRQIGERLKARNSLPPR